MLVQAVSPHFPSPSSVRDTVWDTVTVVSQAVPLQQYVEILEKTNQQLSIWGNPYGVMVAVLGVLFAIGAIVAAILLWRQSADYEKKIHASLASLATANALVVESLAEADRRIDAAIAELRGAADEAVGEQRKTLEELATRLQAERPPVPTKENRSFQDLLEVLKADAGTPVNLSQVQDILRAYERAKTARDVRKPWRLPTRDASPPGDVES